MKSFAEFLNEAKATYCGRCGTTHVPPSQGGTCPALKKEEAELEEGHQVVAKTKQGETFKSAVYPTKDKALAMHYKMSKSGNYKSIETVPVKEEADLEEGFENLPGKATHLTKVDVRHPEHGIIPGSTTLRHLGGNKYEVRAGRAKGKTIALDDKHVQKLSEEVEQIDELKASTYTSYIDRVTDPAIASKRGKTQTGTLKSIKAIGGVAKAIGKRAKAQMSEEDHLDEADQMDELGEAVEKDYHSVHINGRMWKTFDSRSHAENVAKKIKGATVHKYDAERLQRNYAAKSTARNAARGKDLDEVNQMTLSRYAAKACADQSKDHSKGVETANRKLRFGEYSEMVDAQSQKQ